MRGEFIGVWSETWREIWLPLIDHDGVPEDIFCELYRELAQALKDTPSVEALADIIDNRVQSREAFEQTGANDFAGECALVAFLEAAHSALDELAAVSQARAAQAIAGGYFKKSLVPVYKADGGKIFDIASYPQRFKELGVDAAISCMAC